MHIAHAVAHAGAFSLVSTVHRQAEGGCSNAQRDQGKAVCCACGALNAGQFPTCTAKADRANLLGVHPPLDHTRQAAIPIVMYTSVHTSPKSLQTIQWMVQFTTADGGCGADISISKVPHQFGGVHLGFFTER